MANSNDSAPANSRRRRGYQRDRFDTLKHSGRVGAHRFTARPRYFWQYFTAAVLGFAVLTAGGIVAVNSIGGSPVLPGKPAPSPAQQPEEPVAIDPEATVSVLNGTPVEGLAAQLDSIITAEAWGHIVFSGTAATSEVEISAVFYRDPADKGIAKALAMKLGGISTYPTKEYSEHKARLIVLLGADYSGPGMAEDAKKDAPERTDDTPEIDPGTGFPIDPDTGYAVDPATGTAYDPSTGQPVQ